jgi:hypothetical protein
MLAEPEQGAPRSSTNFSRQSSKTPIYLVCGYDISLTPPRVGIQSWEMLLLKVKWATSTAFGPLETWRQPCR